jgi:glycerol-3-phosphate cytidylyltransferase|tara:strand:+ start:102 stop:530 length:429 start_codon:yes stop_codon:yes gene_type:complete
MIKGVIAGNFDVMHPGYIKMFKECADNCDCLIVLLHSDPSIERPHKLKPILSVKERREMLSELKSVCDIFEYNYEAQLYDLLKVGEFNIRFLGSDYINEPFTGDDLKIPIHYLDRSHGWSTTRFKEEITRQVYEQRKLSKYL